MRKALGNLQYIFLRSRLKHKNIKVNAEIFQYSVFSPIFGFSQKI